jgi:hypothetical protein
MKEAAVRCCLRQMEEIPFFYYTFAPVHLFSGITSQFIVDLPLPNKMLKTALLVFDDEVEPFISALF